MKRKVKIFFLLFFIGIGMTFAQTQVKGVVLDVSSDPVIGASIQIKGTGQGTITDVNGEFSLSAPSDAVLVVSYVGMKTQEVAVQPSLRIILEDDTEQLQELVVVGYGTQRKENLTGAVSSVDVRKTLEAKPYTDISAALQGSVPGLSIINSSGKVGAQPSISIRGLGTLSNNATSVMLILN